MIIVLFLLWIVVLTGALLLHRQENGSPASVSAYAFARRFAAWAGLLAGAASCIFFFSGKSSGSDSGEAFAFYSALLFSPVLGAIFAVFIGPFLYLGSFALRG